MEEDRLTVREKIRFVCQQCGYWSPRWMGRCPECGTWGGLLEEREVRMHPPPLGPHGPGEGPKPITGIDATAFPRLPTDVQEFDRVLGGGIVPGSLILIGGEPGVGKSTLLLQACAGVASRGEKVLYVSGEESLEQVRGRGERLKALHRELLLMAETNLGRILEAAEAVSPRFLVMDSVQTTYTEEMESPPGSLSQIREVAARLMRFAKETKVSVLLIGHVTKDGSLAGPKALEHIVDAVLSFEGERQLPYRILRATKNRFGSTEEIGVFEMTEEGLLEVTNPSELFLAERSLQAPGSVVVPTMEGTRPILVELQALVTSTGAAIPRRVFGGLDFQRASLILAIVEKRLGLPLAACDVYLNVAGGVRVSEPAADLAIAAAVVSSFKNAPVDPSAVIFGEVGLGGEVRAVRSAERRLMEGVRLGFARGLLPQANLERQRMAVSMQLTGLRSVLDLVRELFNG